MNVETVKIQAKNEQGFIIINKDDLKESDKIFNQEIKLKKPKK